MHLKVFCGYIKDDKKVIRSASGGLATAMSEKTIIEENVVYGVSYTEDFKEAKYLRIDTIEEINKFKGSKYIKASLNKKILDLLIEDLISGKKVLFIGLPCDINIVDSYLNKSNIDKTNLLLVDLICHGPTYPKVAKEYIEKLENRFNSKVVDFSVRYKNPYWTPPYLYARFKNNREYIEKFYDTDYGIAFSMMPTHMCYSCNYKNNYKSDITIGDYWGATKDDEGYNKYGTSVAFVHTEKGDIFINSLDNFNLYVADEKKAIDANPRYLTPVKETNKKILFKKNFNEKGLFYAVKKNYNAKQRLVRILPKPFVSFLRKVMKKF